MALKPFEYVYPLQKNQGLSGLGGYGNQAVQGQASPDQSGSGSILQLAKLGKDIIGAIGTQGPTTGGAGVVSDLAGMTGFAPAAAGVGQTALGATGPTLASYGATSGTGAGALGVGGAGAGSGAGGVAGAGGAAAGFGAAGAAALAAYIGGKYIMGPALEGLGLVHTGTINANPAQQEEANAQGLFIQNDGSVVPYGDGTIGRNYWSNINSMFTKDDNGAWQQTGGFNQHGTGGSIINPRGGNLDSILVGGGQ